MNIQRSPRSPYIKGVRPMVKADIESLREPSARPRVAKLRDSHLAMIRMFAAGLTNAEVAHQTGYTQSRVSLIRNTPAVQERVAKFHEAADSAAQKSIDSINEMQLEIARKGSRYILDKLEDGELPDNLVLKAVDSALDRTGYQRKTSKETNINVNFAARMEAALIASRKVRIIDAE